MCVLHLEIACIGQILMLSGNRIIQLQHRLVLLIMLRRTVFWLAQFQNSSIFCHQKKQHIKPNERTQNPRLQTNILVSHLLCFLSHIGWSIFHWFLQLRLKKAIGSISCHSQLSALIITYKKIPSTLQESTFL